MIYEVIVKPNSKKGPLIVEESFNADKKPDARPHKTEESHSSHDAEKAKESHRLVVYLREKPIDGEANTALIRLLAKHFCVAKGCIEIKTGARGHRKLVEVIDNKITWCF